MSFEDMFDESFDELGDKLGLDLEKMKTMFGAWEKLSTLIPDVDFNESGSEAFMEAFAEQGVDITMVLLFGARLATLRAEKGVIDATPEGLAEWASTWSSGYMLGYLVSSIEAGNDPLGAMTAKLGNPKPKRKRKRKRDRFEVKAVPLQVSLSESPPKVASASELAEFMKDRSRDIGESFTEIDDDWAPVLMVVSERKSALVSMQIPEDGEEKDMLFEAVLPAAIAMQFADDDPPLAAGLLVESWTLEPSEQTTEWLSNRERDEKIGDHPDRVDTLAIVTADQDRFEFWTAKIYRDGEQPPGLGQWEHEDMNKTTGRIPDLLRELLS